ncbi:beta-N-acetylhexosaminidase [Parasalinivibrio latis]|uniref:beta-N-acetylhexosaminidase n=1 Tax=Parasalinivibrio latis TaxID=2952610 RepID=UPI0030E3972A
MNFRVDLSLLEAKPDNSRFALTLHNLGEEHIRNWQLTFSFGRYIDPNSLSHGSMEQVGYLCKYTAQESLPAYGHHYVEFSINCAPLVSTEDTIGEACVLVTQNGNCQAYTAEHTPTDLGLGHLPPQALKLPDAADLSLIPRPYAVARKPGQFALTNLLSISVETEMAQMAASWLSEELEEHTGTPVPMTSKGQIHFKRHLLTDLKAGAYILNVARDHIDVFADSHEGFVAAVSTLLQLLPAYPSHRAEASYVMPCVTIEDKPRFAYRGMMLDCARHFHPLSRVKRLINQLARYKFNYFQWHLTDDEGWRIEIDAYPELTEIGAWRGPEENIEPQFTELNKRHGGFYSKKEVREVIAFAAKRGVTVVPEIDIPGHSRAAIKSLPDLLVEEQDQSRYRSIQNYSDNVLNPGIEGTYTFLRNILDEVCELFPSPYIHIGADEVPQGVWTDSPACQALMEKQGYRDPKELQGHLLRYAEEYLHGKGKRMLGWEEAVHGDKVSKDTVIYSWSSEQAGQDCVESGYDVVMQPGQYTYLDMTQSNAADEAGATWGGVVPLEKSYSYEPLADLPYDSPKRHQILGIQCALWCEFIHTQSRFDYMVYPRLPAIAEVCWSSKEQRDWNDFLSRLAGHLKHLDRQGINYRL